VFICVYLWLQNPFPDFSSISEASPSNAGKETARKWWHRRFSGVLEHPGAACHLSARIASEIMKEGATVPDWLQIILVMAAYIVLMRWVLPRLGVGT
jgi:hypothetical protein